MPARGMEAAAAAPCTREGYLEKKGEHLGAGWKRRFCRLEGTTLSYYVAADRRAKKGEIVHEAGASVSLARYGPRYGFTIATKKRTFRLRCSSAEAAQRWIDSLVSAWAPSPAEGVLDNADDV